MRNKGIVLGKSWLGVRSLVANFSGMKRTAMGFGERHNKNHRVLSRPRQNEARLLDGLSGPKEADGRLWEISLLASILCPSLYPHSLHFLLHKAKVAFLLTP